MKTITLWNVPVAVADALRLELHTQIKKLINDCQYESAEDLIYCCKRIDEELALLKEVEEKKEGE